MMFSVEKLFFLFVKFEKIYKKICYIHARLVSWSTCDECFSTTNKVQRIDWVCIFSITKNAQFQVRKEKNRAMPIINKQITKLEQFFFYSILHERDFNRKRARAEELSFNSIHRPRPVRWFIRDKINEMNAHERLIKCSTLISTSIDISRLHKLFARLQKRKHPQKPEKFSCLYVYWLRQVQKIDL